MRNIVCTNCGCETLIRTTLPFRVTGQYVDICENPTLRIYACFECGHLEFFDSYAVDKYIEKTWTLNSIKSELEISRKRLSDLENSKINDEIMQIERRLTSLDITIRQQQELQARVRELQDEARKIPNEIAALKKQIEEKERKLSEVQQYIEKAEVIVG